MTDNLVLSQTDGYRTGVAIRSALSALLSEPYTNVDGHRGVHPMGE